MEQEKLGLLPSIVPPSGWYGSPVLALDAQGHPTLAFASSDFVEVRTWNGQEWVAPEGGGLPAWGLGRIAIAIGPDGSVIEARASYSSGLDLAKLPAPLH